MKKEKDVREVVYIVLALGYDVYMSVTQSSICVLRNHDEILRKESPNSIFITDVGVEGGNPK